MTAIKPTFSRKLIIKRSIGAAGILVVILIALNIWFVLNARSVLKEYINVQSKGRIKLELSKLDLNFLSQRLHMHNAEIISTDSLRQPITYRVSFAKLSLKVGSVWELLFHKKLIFDSLNLSNPNIEVIQWRKDTAQRAIKNELSLPQEMGKLYNSLRDALDEFGVRRILINNAKISLVNKITPGIDPVTVSNIYFDLARTPGEKGSTLTPAKKDQKLELKTFNQNIKLPGGRHQLSFKSFNLHLFRKTIVLDSCTVTALPTDSIKSHYQVFFKKLSLTGVDFAALSAQNLIKADTVYCENPFFDFSLYRSDAVTNKTKRPNPNKIIRELTANLDLAFVGVRNAGLHFVITGKTSPSFFNSHKDNFEIRGLRINPDSSNPVRIGQFDMTLRDYHLQNEDSSSTFSFDSLHFLNDRAVLHNFAVSSNSGKNKIRNLVKIKIPYFELQQLDWDQLIFEQNLEARTAVLNSPVINFTRQKNSEPGKKTDLFEKLLNVDSLVALENLSVTNGQINMQLGPSTSFNLKNVDFKIKSNKLLHSTNKEGLRNAVENLSFSEGILRLKEITAQLQNARFNTNKLLHADKVSVSSKDHKIMAAINNVQISNMQLDDDAENVDVNGIEWKSATVSILSEPSLKNTKKTNGSNIHLRNVAGNNTQLIVAKNATTTSTFVETLNAELIVKKNKEPLWVKGFEIKGNNFVLADNTLKINADSYTIISNGASYLTDVVVQQNKGLDSLRIQSVGVDFSVDLNELFAENLHFSSIHTTAPFIQSVKRSAATESNDTISGSTIIHIDTLTAIEPAINITTYHHDSAAVINIPPSDKSIVTAGNIRLADDDIQIATVQISGEAATLLKTTGESLGVDDGKIQVDISNLELGKKEGKFSWSGTVNNLYLQNPNGFTLGKSGNNLRLREISLGNLQLSSGILSNLNEMMQVNPLAWMRIPYGQFVDSNTTVQWYNAAYSNNSRTFTLDSLVYHPTKSLDSVLAHAPYQLDYITLHTGAIAIDGLYRTQQPTDSAFIANTITIKNPVLTVFHDRKAPPSPHKKVKPLPVNILKNLRFPVSVERVEIDSGFIMYSERNGVSRKRGDFLLTNVNAMLSNIKNHDIKSTDSLALIFNSDFMNNAAMSVRVKESYTDSLSSFILTANVNASNLSMLNRALVPLSNVQIKSGSIDSFRMRFTAREDLAFGELKMDYNDLRIRFINNGDPTKSTFSKKLTSFIANTFVIKKRNKSRIGIVYYKRSDKQSFFTYVIKSTLSGIGTSIGAKNNRRYIKQYLQQLHQSKLPPVVLYPENEKKTTTK